MKLFVWLIYSAHFRLVYTSACLFTLGLDNIRGVPELLQWCECLHRLGRLLRPDDEKQLETPMTPEQNLQFIKYHLSWTCRIF